MSGYSPGRWWQHSPVRRALNLELRALFYKNLYYNPAVSGPLERSRRDTRRLFQSYLKHHEQVGGQARRPARRDGWPRAICDYLAGMTDRYAMCRASALVRRSRG